MKTFIVVGFDAHFSCSAGKGVWKKTAYQPKKKKQKQNGFRRNRSTTSQILTIRRILEGVRAKNLQATLIFVDFTKAFDSIHRGKMEQILLAYGIPKETVAAITVLYRNTKVKVRSPDGDTEYFDIVAGVLQGDTLAPYLFIICLDYVLRTSIDKIKENGFELTKKRSRRYPATTITDADYADDIAILANTPDQAETLLHSLERAAAGIGLHVNAHKTEYMCYNQTGDISTLKGTPLKLVDKFTYLGSSVKSTEKDIETRLTKAWTAINRLSIIWKSDLTDKMKRSFFQAAVTSILLYGCTTWTLTKRLEKKLDGNYTRMLHAILNKSWQQHPKRHQLYGHLPPITKTIQVRRTRHAGHCWRSRDELIRDVLLWIPTHGRAKAGRPAQTYIQQLCEDTGCCPEDLPRAMNDREEWRERVRDIRAASTIWWWWQLWIRVDLRVMAIKRYSTFPGAQELNFTIKYSLVLYPGYFFFREACYPTVENSISAFYASPTELKMSRIRYVKKAQIKQSKVLTGNAQSYKGTEFAGITSMKVTRKQL